MKKPRPPMPAQHPRCLDRAALANVIGGCTNENITETTLAIKILGPKV